MTDLKEPTPEQIRELWEWCGFKRKEWKNNPNHFYWETPYGNLSMDYSGERLPPIDLNNLFKWAMPKLDQSRYYKVLKSIFLKSEYPALALFWAIWEVIKK